LRRNSTSGLTISIAIIMTSNWSMPRTKGGGAKDQAHLIGERPAATGPIRRKLALVPIDQVLRLPVGAVEIVIDAGVPQAMVATT
jgi:hypothetical protein